MTTSTAKDGTGSRERNQKTIRDHALFKSSARSTETPIGSNQESGNYRSSISSQRIAGDGSRRRYDLAGSNPYAKDYAENSRLGYQHPREVHHDPPDLHTRGSEQARNTPSAMESAEESSNSGSSLQSNMAYWGADKVTLARPIMKTTAATSNRSYQLPRKSLYFSEYAIPFTGQPIRRVSQNMKEYEPSDEPSRTSTRDPDPPRSIRPVIPRTRKVIMQTGRGGLGSARRIKPVTDGESPISEPPTAATLTISHQKPVTDRSPVSTREGSSGEHHLLRNRVHPTDNVDKGESSAELRLKYTKGYHPNSFRRPLNPDILPVEQYPPWLPVRPSPQDTSAGRGGTESIRMRQDELLTEETEVKRTLLKRNRF